MTLLESNLNALSSRGDRLVALLRDLELPEELEFETARSGAPTARRGGHYLHSRYDPSREAQRLAGKIASVPGDCVVIFGFGLGYVAEAIASSDPERDLLIVERDPAMLKAALSSRDLSALLRSSRSRFLIAPGPDEFTRILSGQGCRRPISLGTPSATESDRSYYGSIEEARKRYLERRQVNSNTLRRFGRRWIRNLAANVNILAQARGVSELYGRFAGIPALVCAGGPSLDAVLQHLPAIRERALIIAVDTAVRPLVQAGVEPDFVIVVDPQYWNTRHLDNLDLRRSYVVGESSTHPRAFRILRRPVFLCSSLFPLGGHLEKIRGNFGALGTGGSVATSAWDFARRLGSAPVFLAGLDLGYPAYRTHVSGSLFEERSHFIAKRSRTAETLQVAYIEGGRPYPVAANDGTQVLTDQRMAVYADWFSLQQEDGNAPESVNLSSRGMRIRGFRPGALSELLSQAPRRSEIDAVIAGIGDAPATSEEDIRGYLTAALRELSNELSRTGELAEEALGVVRRQIDGRHAASESGRPLEAVEEDLRALQHRDIVGFLLESTAEELSEARPDSYADALENSRRLYSAIRDSAAFHAEMLQRAETVLKKTFNLSGLRAENTNKG